MLNENQFYISDNGNQNADKKNEKKEENRIDIDKSKSAYNKRNDRIMTVGITILAIEALFTAFILGAKANS